MGDIAVVDCDDLCAPLEHAGLIASEYAVQVNSADVVCTSIARIHEPKVPGVLSLAIASCYDGRVICRRNKEILRVHPTRSTFARQGKRVDCGLWIEHSPGDTVMVSQD